MSLMSFRVCTQQQGQLIKPACNQTGCIYMLLYKATCIAFKLYIFSVQGLDLSVASASTV